MEGDKYRFLDVGGGADWGDRKVDIQTLEEDTSNLRVFKLAKENPEIEYFIFDAHIPTPIVARKTSGIPNLHFVQGLLAANQHLPFKDTSMDRVEMSHMYSPLFLDPALFSAPRQLTNSIDPNDTTQYFFALKEASRVLKPGGTLAITEKKERIDKIFNLLSDSLGELSGNRIHELRMDPNYHTQKITRVTDPNRTMYTRKAFDQQRFYEERGENKKVNSCNVFTLELRKI